MEHVYKRYGVLVTKWKGDLFLRARLKLTVAYVGVFALVLGIFSYFLYNALLVILGENIDEHVLDLATRAHFFDRASHALQSQILIVDAITLLFVSLFSYILTGLTLRPIRKARDRERRFLADAAHELRTPLSVMRSGNEVVLRGEATMSLRVKKLLTENVGEIDLLTQISNGLLALASEKEKSAGKTGVVDVREILSSVIEKLMSLAYARSLELSLNGVELSDALMVRADRNTLTRIFENLIENGIKYTKVGSIRVALEHNRKSVIIRIQDTGIGISSEDIEHVTEPFFRADAARTSMEGSGLGLSIVSESLEMYGGSLSIESELGVGTIVRVTLPLATGQ